MVGSCTGDNRNTANPWHILSPINLVIRRVSFFLYREFRCRTCVVKSSLWKDVVSITQMWDLPHPNSYRSHFRFTLLNFLFIHGLSCLQKRFKNPKFVLFDLPAIMLLSFQLSHVNFFRLFPVPPTVTICSHLVRSLPSFTFSSTILAIGAVGLKIFWSHIQCPGVLWAWVQFPSYEYLQVIKSYFSAWQRTPRCAKNQLLKERKLERLLLRLFIFQANCFICFSHASRNLCFADQLPVNWICVSV